MALPTFAEVEDVQAVWGELTLAEETQVSAWLVTASNNLRLIGRERGVDVDSFILGDDLLEQAAKDAVVESIRRRLMNPEGIRQRSRTTTDGPFSDTSSETIDTAISSGGLYFNDDDLRWLPPVRSGRNRFRSLRAKSGYYS